MIGFKKIIIGTIVCLGCLCVAKATSKYIFAGSASNAVNCTIDVKDRDYVVNNITLSVGKNGITCSSQNSEGDNFSDNQDEIKNFFVEKEDVTDVNDNHFVKLKKFYIQMSQDASTGTITYKLSGTKVDSTYFCCPYFYDKDGNEVSYAYYGKYKGYVYNGKLCSKSGVTPTTNKSIDNFRTYARANGDQYHQTDWCAVFTTQIMFMCTYKTTNASTIFTYRNKGSLTGSGEQILGIEDFVGNGFECVDGVIFTGKETLAESTLVWADKISDYKANITTNQTTLIGATGTSEGYISKMYYNNGKPALSIFPKELSGSSSTYYCDSFTFSNYDDYQTCVLWGALNSSEENYGLYFLDTTHLWEYGDSDFGSRLHAKFLNLN